MKTNSKAVRLAQDQPAATTSRETRPAFASASLLAFLLTSSLACAQSAPAGSSASPATAPGSTTVAPVQTAPPPSSRGTAPAASPVQSPSPLPNAPTPSGQTASPQPGGGNGPGLDVPPPPERLGGLPAVVPPGALTMQQAVDIALARNPTLLAAQQNLLSVRALEVQAAVRQNPNLTVIGTNVTLPAAGAANPYSYAGQISRLFELGGKRHWRIDSARATTAQTDAQYHTTEQQTTFAVRQAFTNFIVAKTAKKLADENLADFRRELQIAQDRYQAGDLAKLDFERLDLQLAQFETDQSNAITSAQQASDQLQVLLGYDRPRTDFDIVGDVVPPSIAVPLDELEQRGLANRADLKAAQAAVAVADAQLRLAKAYSLPDPTLEGEYDRSGRDSSAGFYFNVPIRIFDRNQGNIASTRYTTQANRFAVTAAHNQVISDIDQAYSGYLNSRLLSDRYNGHYLDEARDVLDIARFSFEHGGLALIDYLDALREARSVTSNALSAYQQTWIAIHQLGLVTATNPAP